MSSLTYLDLDGPEGERLIARFATPEDRADTARFRNPDRRRQSLGARALLRAVLSETMGGDWRLVRDPGGAPRLEGRHAPFISLSHSHAMVACAVSMAGRVGVDVERQREDRSLDAISAAVFGPRESAAVRRLGSAAFYRIWTQREALAKATGIGFPLVVRQLDLTPDDGACVPVEGVDWSLGHWVLPGSYSLATALEAGPVPQPRPYAPA